MVHVVPLSLVYVTVKCFTVLLLFGSKVAKPVLSSIVAIPPSSDIILHEAI
jgi:hypothetical protein